MNNIVSFETAKRLKAAGFPQGGWKEGIAIYSSTGETFIIGEDVGSSLNGWTVCSPSSIECTDIFAPSATDILPHLGIAHRLVYAVSGWWCDIIEELPDDTDGFRVIEAFNDETPAEAAAAAWLSIHEKKQ